MARRSEHTQEEIKQMVINAAEMIIVEGGLAKLTVRNVATEMGYTVGTVYMVFNNMADLILHLKARTLDDIDLHLQKANTGNTSQACLITLANAYLNFANQHFNRWHMLYDQRAVPDLITPDWYRFKLSQLSNPVARHVERLAPQATAEQKQRATQALWGGVHGICVLSLAGSLDKLALKEVEATVALLVENFIRSWMLNPHN